MEEVGEEETCFQTSQCYVYILHTQLEHVLYSEYMVSPRKKAFNEVSIMTTFSISVVYIESVLLLALVQPHHDNHCLSTFRSILSLGEPGCIRARDVTSQCPSHRYLHLLQCLEGTDKVRCNTLNVASTRWVAKTD